MQSQLQQWDSRVQQLGKQGVAIVKSAEDKSWEKHDCSITFSKLQPPNLLQLADIMRKSKPGSWQLCDISAFACSHRWCTNHEQRHCVRQWRYLLVTFWADRFSVSILTAIFQVYLGRHQNISILDFIGTKVDGGGDNNWSYTTCKTPNKPTPSFLQAGTLPVAQLRGADRFINWLSLCFHGHCMWQDKSF